MAKKIRSCIDVLVDMWVVEGDGLRVHAVVARVPVWRPTKLPLLRARWEHRDRSHPREPGAKEATDFSGYGQA
jgi:hypothetical protein